MPGLDPSSSGGQENDSPDLDDTEAKIGLEERGASGGVLDRVLSRTRSRSSYLDPGPPPDGGVRAWTQSLCGHLIVCNTWGYISSFGVFQTYYVSALGHPPSDISWIGSVQIFLLFFIGTFSGRATDYGLFKPTILLGSFFMLFGVFMTSLSTKYVMLAMFPPVCLLIMVGIGNCSLRKAYAPALATVYSFVLPYPCCQHISRLNDRSPSGSQRRGVPLEGLFFLPSYSNCCMKSAFLGPSAC